MNENTTSPEIENMMVLNIQHLDPGTLDSLNNRNHFGILDVWDYKYGYGFITAAVYAALDEHCPVPVCLRNIVKRATNAGCVLVLMDEAGTSVEDLEEWTQ